MRQLNILLLGLLLASQFQFAQFSQHDSILNINQFEEITIQEKWKVYKDKKGVTLKYRWMKLNDDAKTRQLSLSFKSSKKVSELLELIKHPELAPQWNSSIREQVISEDEESSWVSHTVFAIPYPLNQQDLVVKNNLKKSDKEVVVDAYSVPNHIKELDNTKRQQFYLSQWRFKQNGDSEMDVEFSLVSMSKSAIPRFIRDPIVLNRLINSFIELKNWGEGTY